MEKAVYYREKYFLLPKEFADAEDLKQVARSASEPLTIQVLVLLEDYRIPCNNLEKGICIRVSSSCIVTANIGRSG